MANISPDEHDKSLRETSSTQATVHRPHEIERSLKVVTGGSVTEAVAGAGAVVLAILGLSGALPLYMASIAAIAIGVALLAHGGAIASQHSSMVRELTGYRDEPRLELSGGVAAETFGGAAGIVLGILALLNVLPMVLLAATLIVFGGTLLLGSGVTVDVSNIPEMAGRRAQMTRDASVGASGLQALAGVGAIVLGILALVGMAPLTLTLVGLLAVGAAVLLSGSAVSTRMLGMLRR